MGGTDCAQPMLYAMEKNLKVDVFIVYTDSETHSGGIHPSEALRQYRAASGVDAKLIVVAMTSNGFTLADPNDSGMLDIAGFDSAAPDIMGEFVAGNIWGLTQRIRSQPKLMEGDQSQTSSFILYQ